MLADRPVLRRWLKRTFAIALPVAALVLVGLKIRDLDWREVGNALVSYSAGDLLVALAIAVPAFVACASYDLIGRHMVGHRLPVPRTMLISFTGYFFSLNLGALVGGLAFRYRLYMSYGLSPIRISKIIGVSVLTNWSGFVLIAALVLMASPAEVFDLWPIDVGAARIIGAALLLADIAYVAFCGLQGGTTLRIRDSTITLPGLGTAAVQIVVSVLNWAAIGAIITWLLPAEVSWFMVMPVLMTSALAGIWSHVPGGLGVTEAVFVTMLGGTAPEATILAAIVTFRAVYYLLPFLIALAAFALLEATADRHDAADGDANDGESNCEFTKLQSQL